jgi:hypothetical protein
MVFDPCVTALSSCREIIAKNLFWEIVSDVSIEISVSRISRITLPCTPYLLARLTVSGKASWAGWSVIGRENGKARMWVSIENTMGIYDEPPQVVLH